MENINATQKGDIKLKKKKNIVTLITLLLAAAVCYPVAQKQTPKDNQGSSDPTADFQNVP